MKNSKRTKVEMAISILAIAIQKQNEEFLKLEIQKLREELIKELNLKKEYLTKNEVCQIYKISPTTLERYIRDGLKVYSTGKYTSRKFLKAELDDYLEYRAKLNRRNYGRLR
ncbi:helix-turn-helix domain-containing protein [Flavobacterium sediminilitoris]|uniref:Helix-turn-helix domain-containing protein n=1 Tax=Flavobacterium sediminilitoris TaxID=2024526 RepID=A0ABY4HI42_9FLAO|nr:MULTISPECIES: helix-turn-helix domain-containing protein [Flavobacterium]UOX32373.1 helix-turn-helix domain-containing protein [Flavobacterium sediminilitoris]